MLAALLPNTSPPHTPSPCLCLLTESMHLRLGNLLSQGGTLPSLGRKSHSGGGRSVAVKWEAEGKVVKSDYLKLLNNQNVIKLACNHLTTNQ